MCGWRGNWRDEDRGIERLGRGGISFSARAVELRWNKPLRKVTHTHADTHNGSHRGDGDDGVVLIANEPSTPTPKE